MVNWHPPVKTKAGQLKLNSFDPRDEELVLHWSSETVHTERIAPSTILYGAACSYYRRETTSFEKVLNNSGHREDIADNYIVGNDKSHFPVGLDHPVELLKDSGEVQYIA